MSNYKVNYQLTNAQKSILQNKIDVTVNVGNYTDAYKYLASTVPYFNAGPFMANDASNCKWRSLFGSFFDNR